MDTHESFGRWLRRRRRALDLTQEALAACAGCAVPTIRKFEADERRPSRQLAELLAACLQVPAGERAQFIAFARRPLAALVEGDEDKVERTPAIATPLPNPVGVARAIPTPLTPLLGRDDDIRAVAKLLAQSGVRVVTLTGPGGTGKTRLAIAAGRHVAESHDAPAGPVVFVDLAPVEEAALVMPTIARALNVKEAAQRSPLDSLVAHLGQQPALLILDNFEQVVAAAGDLQRLLLAAGGLKLLITSRATLRLYGEHEYPVSPLAPPPPSARTPEAVAASPAAALFVTRSRAANPGFRLTAANAPAVADLCARLDGLPLAIELAAARSKLLSPAALLAQLGGVLDLSAVHTAVARQRTLRETIDWSYRLLTPAEQRLFAHLAVFSGPFTLGAAAVVCAGAPLPEHWPAAPDAAGPAFLDELTSLVDKSMIQLTGETEDETRFRLLVVLRNFALERLAEREERDEAAGRHLAYYHALARHTAPLLEGNEQAAWLGRLAAEEDDFRAALAYGLERPAQQTTALELATALANYWRFQGRLTEGRSWLDRALATVPAAPLLMAEATAAAGVMARAQDDMPAAREWLSRSLKVYRSLGEAADGHALATVLRNLGAVDYWQEAPDAAEHHWLEALALEQAAGNLPAVASLTFNLGIINRQLRRPEQARRYYEEAAALLRRVGNTLSLINCLSGLANLAFNERRFDECNALLTEVEALARGIGNGSALAMTLANLADGELVQGRLDEARRYYEASLASAREGGFLRHVANSMTGLATVDLLQGRDPAAVWPALREALDILDEIKMNLMKDFVLYAVALLLAIRGRYAPAVALMACLDQRQPDELRLPHFQAMYDHVAPGIHAALDEAALAAAEARGQALSLDEAEVLARTEAEA